MGPLFQKLTPNFSGKIHQEPPKKLLHQDPLKWSPRTKTALAAFTTFSTLGVSYLAYRYSFPKINIPDSISSPIGTASKTIASLTTLTGLGLLAYFSNSKTQISTTTNSEEKKETFSSKSTTNRSGGGKI